MQQGKADPDDIATAKCKCQAQLDEYKGFSEQFNLPEQRERIYAGLRGRVAPSAQTYAKWQAGQLEKKLQAEAKRQQKARK